MSVSLPPFPSQLCVDGLVAVIAKFWKRKLCLSGVGLVDSPLMFKLRCGETRSVFDQHSGNLNVMMVTFFVKGPIRDS